MDTNSFWSALLGGFFALFGVVITLYFQRKHSQQDERKQELAFVSSIKCELASLQDLMERRQEELIKGKTSQFGIIEKYYFINQNYFSFFDQNMINISKLNRQDIKLRIQKLILHAKSYLDTIQAHNDQLKEVAQKSSAQEDVGTTKAKLEYYESLRNFKVFEAELIETAKTIYNEVITLQEELEIY